MGNERPQVTNQLGRQLCLLKGLGDEVVTGTRKSNLSKLILFYKKIKKVRSDDGQGGDDNLNFGQKLGGDLSLKNFVHAGKALSFSTQ